MYRCRSIFFAVIFLISACSDEHENIEELKKATETVYIDEASLCLHPGEKAFDQNLSGSVTSQEPFRVFALAEFCASGCTEILESSCTWNLVDNVVEIQSQFRTILPVQTDEPCPAQCVTVGTYCTSSADKVSLRLEEGAYQIHQGNQKASLTVPRNSTQCLFTQ